MAFDNEVSWQHGKKVIKIDWEKHNVCKFKYFSLGIKYAKELNILILRNFLYLFFLCTSLGRNLALLVHLFSMFSPVRGKEPTQIVWGRKVVEVIRRKKSKTLKQALDPSMILIRVMTWMMRLIHVTPFCSFLFIYFSQRGNNFSFISFTVTKTLNFHSSNVYDFGLLVLTHLSDALILQFISRGTLFPLT